VKQRNDSHGQEQGRGAGEQKREPHDKIVPDAGGFARKFNPWENSHG
jgi:hypothetical protein